MHNADGCMTFPPRTRKGQREEKEFLTSTSPSNTLFTVSENVSPVSACLSGWLQSPWFVGQNRWSAAHFHALISMKRFALTVHGWMWVWRGRGTELIHLRSFPSWFGIYKRKLHTNRHTPGFISLDIFWCMYISSFVHMRSFTRGPRAL